MMGMMEHGYIMTYDTSGKRQLVQVVVLFSAPVFVFLQQHLDS